MMTGMALKSGRRRQIFASAVGVVASAMFTHLGCAQVPQSFSAMFKESNLIGMPGGHAVDRILKMLHGI